MNKSSENLGRPFVPYSQSAKVLKPGISSFDDPSMLISSQFSPILMSGNLIVTTCRNDRLDTAPDQLGSKLIAVIGTVSHQSFWFTMLTLSNFYSDIIQRCFGQFYFRWGGLLHVYSERSTCAIGQYHEICSLAAFSLPDHWPPFFARTNIPSMKHSSHFTFCWSESWFKKALHKFSKTSFSAHSFNRLFTVLLVPYFSGSSLQGAPVHRIQSMPSKHLRSSAGGRPPFLLGGLFGKCSFIRSHCLSVSDRQAMVFLLDLVNYRFNWTCQPVVGCLPENYPCIHYNLRLV